MSAALDVLLMLAIVFGFVLYMGIGVKIGSRFEDTSNPENLDVLLMLWAILWPLMLPLLGMVVVVRRLLDMGGDGQ